MEKKLFNLIHGVGGLLDGKIHIIDQTNRECSEPDKIEYRVYHGDGYCFYVSRERRDPVDLQELNPKNNYDYEFFAEWDGFKDLNEKEALGLVCFLRTKEEREIQTEKSKHNGATIRTHT